MIEVDAIELIEFLKNAEETKNINYYFYPGKLNIMTDMTITLSKGFPPFKLEFELKRNDTDSVSIGYIYIWYSSLFNYVIYS